MPKKTYKNSLQVSCNILIIRTLKETLKIPIEWFIYKSNTKLIHGFFNRILGPERTVYQAPLHYNFLGKNSPTLVQQRWNKAPLSIGWNILDFDSTFSAEKGNGIEQPLTCISTWLHIKLQRPWRRSLVWRDYFESHAWNKPKDEIFSTTNVAQFSG